MYSIEWKISMHNTAGSLYFIHEQTTLVAVDYGLPTAYQKLQFDFKIEYHILEVL